jgi:hypothetical protein
MKNNRGPAERTFEETIATSPISAHNNPRYGGALNGNDIERLSESLEWIFSTLKSLTTTDEKLSKELSEIEEVWDCFAKIFTLLRLTRLLQMMESSDMIAYIEEFGELFTKNTTKNLTPRIHFLFDLQKKTGTSFLSAERTRAMKRQRREMVRKRK